MNGVQTWDPDFGNYSGVYFRTSHTHTPRNSIFLVTGTPKRGPRVFSKPYSLNLVPPLWLRITTLCCRGGPPPPDTYPLVAACCYIPLLRMLGRGMPHKKTLSLRCLSQARRFCYKAMSQNGRPSLFQTPCFSAIFPGSPLNPTTKRSQVSRKCTCTRRRP